MQTFGLREADRRLESLIPPNQKPGTDFAHDALVLFIHFIMHEVLGGWTNHVTTTSETAVGTNADRLLTEIAVRTGLPLITSEGVTASGIVEKGLRNRARKAGANVFAPREFFAGKIVEADTAYSFLERLAEKRPLYLERCREKFDGDEGKADDLYQLVQRVYHTILFGTFKARE